MKKERILSTAVFLVSFGTGAMASNATPNNNGAALAKQLTGRTGATMPNNLQQNRNEVKVTGTVFDSMNEPVIGATVRVKGEQTATVTDIDGNFTLSTHAGATLVISYLGHQTQEVAVPANGNVTVTLKSESRQIDEVVVTALGIRRSEKALSYNVQKVGTDDLTTVKNTNFMNSLNGKVAGININASSAGMGGATRVVLRVSRKAIRHYMLSMVCQLPTPRMAKRAACIHRNPVRKALPTSTPKISRASQCLVALPQQPFMARPPLKVW